MLDFHMLSYIFIILSENEDVGFDSSFFFFFFFLRRLGGG